MDEYYNGWSNRDTWAMALNLGNDYDVYMQCEEFARVAAIGNEDDVDAFRDELAEALAIYARMLLGISPSSLPDFDPAMHMSPDPKDNHGPDDVDGVNWREIAEGYELSNYV